MILYHFLNLYNAHVFLFAALLYFQGFWLVLFAACVPITNHWLVALSTDRDFFAAIAVINTLSVIQIVHFVVVLFLATSASIERILGALIVWQICAVVAIATLQAAFVVLNPFL